MTESYTFEYFLSETKEFRKLMSDRHKMTNLALMKNAFDALTHVYFLTEDHPMLESTFTAITTEYNKRRSYVLFIKVPSEK
jgi:hypothetical protein